MMKEPIPHGLANKRTAKKVLFFILFYAPPMPPNKFRASKLMEKK